MFHRQRLPGLLIGLALTAAAALAQSEDAARKPPHYYRLDFVVKEVDEGRVINSRSYSLMASTEPGTTASVRTGSQILVQQTPGQYVGNDIGINIDCRHISENGPNLSLTVVAEVSSLPIGDAADSGPRTTKRQNRWDSTLTLPVRKPITILSSDDVSSKRKLQVELTATPVIP